MACHPICDSPPRGIALGDSANAVLPDVWVLPDRRVTDDRVASGTDAAKRDGLTKFVQVGRVVPQRRRGHAGRVKEWTWGVFDVHGGSYARSSPARRRRRYEV